MRRTLILMGLIADGILIGCLLYLRPVTVTITVKAPSVPDGVYHNRPLTVRNISCYSSYLNIEADNLGYWTLIECKPQAESVHIGDVEILSMPNTVNPAQCWGNIDKLHCTDLPDSPDQWRGKERGR